MEIQERNNLMQLSLNLGFDTKSTSADIKTDFLDILNSAKTIDFNNNSSKASHVSDVKKHFETQSKKITTNDDVSAKNKADQSKEKKKEYHKTTETTQNTEIDKNTTVSQKNEDYKTTDTNINNDTAEAKTVDNINVAQTDTQVSSSIPTEEINISLNEEIILPINLEMNNIDMPVIEENLITSEVNLNTSINDIDIIPQEFSTQTEFVPLTPEETPILEEITQSAVNSKNVQQELLQQQAIYFDEKLGDQHHLDISVNIMDEEKIAAPIEKNVLQNSFEITSLFQDIEQNSATIQETDVNFFNENIPTDIDGETLNNTPLNENTTAKPIEYNAAVSQNATIAAVEEKTADNIQTISFASSNVNRSETSLRLQQINNTNEFKGLSKEVIEQIKVNITKSAVKGIDTIDIELKPQDLGKVQIRMYINKDGKLHADIISSRQETSDMLQKEISNLSKSFNEAGYDTDEKSFNFSFLKREQNNSSQQETPLHQFIGETFEQEAQNDLANDNMMYDPRNGLNIKV